MLCLILIVGGLLIMPARAKLTFPDLERGFKDSEEIVLKMSSLYHGTIGELKYVGGDDYEAALDGYAAPNTHSLKNTSTSLGGNGMALDQRTAPERTGSCCSPP